MNKESIALSICQKLHHSGHLAYYAGGFVRDLILKIPSDDIDIATDAAPDVIQSLFKKTIPLGIAFGIVVVVEQEEPFEVATFRTDLSYKDGRRPNKISFCSPYEDALRRDFTINGMFFDPIKKKILDYVGGQEDLKKKLIKAIGNPEIRFTEDRLRMIRACRFAARLHYKIEENTKNAIISKANELFPAVSIERVYQEFQKMKNHNFEKALQLLFELNLLQQVFPHLKELDKIEFNKRLSSFKSLPKKAPTFLFLLELFKDLDKEKLDELVDYLKVSNEKAKIAYFCLEAKGIIKKGPSKYEWVKLYTNPHIETALHFIAAKYSKNKREFFLNENIERQEKLKIHITRKIEKKPVVTSNFLMKHGVVPGKKLGQLLEKAEEISIENNLEEPSTILKELQKDSLWKS